MTDVVNLRMARKRAQRRQDEQEADAQRLAHGQPKHQRSLAAARRNHDSRILEGHKINTGDQE